MSIEVVAAAEAGWPAVAEAFAGPGDQAGCWCQWFRLSDRAMHDGSPEQRRDALEAEVRSPPGPGVVAVDGGVAVGWAGIAPRSGFSRLLRSPITRDVPDEDGVWSVTCFVVPRAQRGRGIAAALLDGAVRHAGGAGARIVEAYPVDTAVRSRVTASELYHGPLSLFERAGFAVVARPSAARAVVRLTLSSG